MKEKILELCEECLEKADKKPPVSSTKSLTETILFVRDFCLQTLKM